MFQTAQQFIAKDLIICLKLFDFPTGLYYTKFCAGNRQSAAEWCNGSTTDSGSVREGSSPSSAAI